LADSFYESFDNGTGALTHNWSGNIDTSVSGQITLDGYSGVMQQPSGSGSGYGYGQYYVTAKLEGDGVGPAALLWPSNDKWPGTELDFVEVLDNGTAYGCAHRDGGGFDTYESRMYGGLDESGVHTYGINWQADKVTFSVDGQDAGTVWMDTDDAANGGTNLVFALMNTSEDTSMTVYDLSYTASGSSTWSSSEATEDDEDDFSTSGGSQTEDTSFASASDESEEPDESSSPTSDASSTPEESQTENGTGDWWL
jgi:beta-glucanase (GH16 family)